MEVQKEVKPWLSKTNWMGFIMAVVSFFPSAAEWVADHPQGFMQIIGFIVIGLRFVTKGKISLK